MEVKRQRYDNIDALKTFAILSVVIIHCFSIKIDFWESGNVVNYVYYFCRTILATSVPIFFVCNGFLLFGKELDIKKHIRKTVKYFLLTYLWGLITIFCEMLIYNIRLSLGEIINIFRAWELGWVNHLWFMGALIRVYLVFPIVKLASEKKKEVLIYILALVLIFVIKNKGLDIASFVETDNQWLASLAIFDPFKDAYDWVYFYFCLGGVLYYYQDKMKEYFFEHRRVNIICIAILMGSCILLFACGVMLSNATDMHWDVVWEGYDMIFTMCAVLTLYVMSLNYRPSEKKISTKAVRIISTNTLGIYFLHMIFVHIWSVSIGNAIQSANMVATLLCGIFALGLSLLGTVLMKKIPIIRMLL